MGVIVRGLTGVSLSLGSIGREFPYSVDFLSYNVKRLKEMSSGVCVPISTLT